MHDMVLFNLVSIHDKALILLLPLKWENLLGNWTEKLSFFLGRQHILFNEYLQIPIKKWKIKFSTWQVIMQKVSHMSQTKAYQEW